jgi:hypothetical protein
MGAADGRARPLDGRALLINLSRIVWQVAGVSSEPAPPGGLPQPARGNPARRPNLGNKPNHIHSVGNETPVRPSRGGEFPRRAMSRGAPAREKSGKSRISF